VRLALDAPAAQVFFPDRVGGGVHVFDAVNDVRLTQEAVATGMAPFDLVVARADGSAGVPGPDPVPGRAPRVWVVPNPLRGAARIGVSLAAPSMVRVVVYDVQGRLVRELAGARVLPAGQRWLVWDGRDAAGRRVTAGTYWLRIEGDGIHSSARATVLR
jgi:hypothetical protein